MVRVHDSSTGLSTACTGSSMTVSWKAMAEVPPPMWIWMEHRPSSVGAAGEDIWTARYLASSCQTRESGELAMMSGQVMITLAERAALTTGAILKVTRLAMPRANLERKLTMVKVRSLLTLTKT